MIRQRHLRHHPSEHRLRPVAGRHRTGYRRAGDDLVGLIPLGRIYESIDMPVIVLVAAMLPVGERWKPRAARN